MKVRAQLISNLHIECVYGRYVLRGGHLHASMITDGQKWAKIDGSAVDATIKHVADGQVTFEKIVILPGSFNEPTTVTCGVFEFQTEFCLIIGG